MLYIIAIGILALLGVMVIYLVRVNLKFAYIERCATSAALERIYKIIEQIGTVPSDGFILARTNKKADADKYQIAIPSEFDYPWAGKVINITVQEEVKFDLIDIPTSDCILAKQIYQPVRVPRKKTKNLAKERNIFAPESYIASSKELRSALEEICPKYPLEFLSYLLCAANSSFEFDVCDQLRIGTNAAWLQLPERQYCDICKKPMHLILQVPGVLINQRFHAGTFYFFGCTVHPVITKSIVQYS